MPSRPADIIHIARYVRSSRRDRVIAASAAADVLRHGWQEAAHSFAADVPEVADLLLARVELAIATGRLDEQHLLETVAEVESVTSRAGSGSGEALARRLRRTVYEYLLALDAVRPVETLLVSVDAQPPASGGGMVGAEEVAALGHAAAAGATRAEPAESAADDSAAVDAEAGGDEDAVTTDGRGPRRRFALRRRQPRDTATAPTAPAGAEPDGGSEALDPADPLAAEDGAGATPDWQFSGADFLAGAELSEPDEAEPAELAATDAPDGDPEPGAVDADAPVASGVTETTEPAATEATTEASPGSEPEQPEQPELPDPSVPAFVAPRAGFHIVDDDDSAHRAPEPEQPPVQMPVFSSDEPALDETADAPAGTEPAETADDDAEFLTWQPSIEDGGLLVEEAAAQAEVHPVPEAAPKPAPEAPAPPETELPPATGTPDAQLDGAGAAAALPAGRDELAEEDTDTDDDGVDRGWRVRDHRQAGRGRGGGGTAPTPEIEDDPFGTNPKLAEKRRRIEERLRRKRCDEAAALLQALAQETGGRAVADLAMNAGDRCRALGKSNAALNCYLAASRSDPVYELPLSRLADVCIDSQDTELAVSYLERIARFYRFRGDDKDALRVYRRIATIAPYREDVLTLLMNAQRSGRLD
jgi:hypothetical protein